MKTCAITISLIVLTLNFASATWKPEYVNSPPEVRLWYQNAELTPEARERLRFTKCCAQSEVVKTQFRVNKTTGGDEWYYLSSDNKWKRVPPDIIHWGEHAPDNQPTLFVLMDGRETCFYPGESGQ